MLTFHRNIFAYTLRHPILLALCGILLASCSDTKNDEAANSHTASPSVSLFDNDMDGIIDAGDACLGSALGQTVDINGCSSYQRGKRQYNTQLCSSCHGERGQGAGSFPAINNHACTTAVPGACGNEAQLASYIAANMPQPGGLCTNTYGATCASDVANYIVIAFAPRAIIGDSDGDSVPDGQDQCPNTQAKDFASINGAGCKHVVKVTQHAFALNAGGAQYTAQDGTTYQADDAQYYAGTESSIGGDLSHTVAVANTQDDTLYRTERWGKSLEYKTPLPNGNYDVTLHLAEVYFEEAGKRIMDVSLEDQKVLTNFDIFADAGGKNIAITKTFTQVNVSDGELNILLQGKTDNGSITAFKVVSIEPNDADGDGLADQYDNCPGTLNNATVNALGCSVAQRDRDNDGILIPDDKCQSTPANQITTVDASGVTAGCSAQERQPDSDSDGAPDAIDKCITPAGEKVGISGCGGSMPLLGGDITSPQMRLTAIEYFNTIKAAFAVNSLPDVSVQSDEKGPFKLFTNNAAETNSRFDTLVSSAQAIANALATDLANRCDWRNSAQQCVNRHLKKPMHILYRSSAISHAQRQGIADIVSNAIAAKATPEQAVAAAIARILVDLRFVFQLEIGQPNISGTQINLTHQELANRLAYWLSESAPDADLVSDINNLSNSAVYEQHVDRLIRSNGFKPVARAFIFEWLGMSTTPKNTDLNTALGAAYQETRLFVDYIIDNELPLSTLFSANYSFINNTLAAHYGIAEPAREWAMNTLPNNSRRQGILTHAYFLAAHSGHGRDKNTIFRGKAIFERIFCQSMPPAPDGAIAASELIADRSVAKACAGCHAVVDPIGRIFDIYDDTGKTYAQSDLEGFFGLDIDIYGPYDDATSLSSAISTSQAATQCFSRQLYRAALGREPKAIEQTSFDAVFATVNAGSSIHEAVKTFVMSQSFQLLHAKNNTMSCQGN